ncbi:MAG: glycosyl hydrolase [Gemmatimonadetes bacterium]|nr:glycosyl hydrolase [Gemmatimonadota bacterium]
MQKRLMQISAAGLAVLLAAGGARAQRAERLFYYLDRPESYQSLVQHIDQMGILAPSVYKVDQDGILWGELDARVIALARARGVGLMPLVINDGFDQQKLHALLAGEPARTRLIQSLVELCRRHTLLGIQIDFENLHLDDRDAFTRFYREAAAALHKAGFKISVAVVHRPDELAGPSEYHKWLFTSWRGGYDLKALAELGDFISVMTYSQHTRRTPPGPQASRPWVEEVIQYFLRFVPPEKLSLGIPLGSQHWYTSQEERITPELARSYSEQLSYDWARGLIERHGASVQWSEEHQVSYAFYARGGTFEWVFLEDARSFRSKLELVSRYRLRGFSAWVLGSEDPAIWEALR